MLLPKALWQKGPPLPRGRPLGPLLSPLPSPPPVQPPPGWVVVAAGTPVPHALLVARLLLTAWTRESTLLELKSLPHGGLQARHSSQGLFE